MALDKSRPIFVSGTDTDAGKTVASLGLMRALQQQGFAVQGYKPVAAGLAENSQILDERCNDDAYLLQHASSQRLSYEQVNPYLFDEPIAPHLAARMRDIRLSAQECIAATRREMLSGSISVVEGAGGWLVPLNERETFADIAKGLDSSVVMVVGIRLGCLNHALLTYDAMMASGVRLLGWIANHCSAISVAEQRVASDNVETLRKRLNIPMLAEIPYQPDLHQVYSAESRDVILDQLASFFRTKYL